MTATYHGAEVSLIGLFNNPINVESFVDFRRYTAEERGLKGIIVSDYLTLRTCTGPPSRTRYEYDTTINRDAMVDI